MSVTNLWAVLEATLIPYFLRSAGVSIGMLQNEESDVFEWSSNSVLQGFNGMIGESHFDEELFSVCGTFPLSVSCHVLTLILDSAWQSLQKASTMEPMLENGSCYAENLFTKLLWDLCNMSERLFLQASDHRSSAMGILLPTVFKSFASHHSLVISVRGKKCVLSR